MIEPRRSVSSGPMNSTTSSSGEKLAVSMNSLKVKRSAPGATACAPLGVEAVTRAPLPSRRKAMPSKAMPPAPMAAAPDCWKRIRVSALYPATRRSSMIRRPV
ncbi:MAG: hypothetical protein BWZ02_00876 [Lentisphaerae bacterium ADurb.BinA184]|nr:MAG: hypothetical protein BWZ02_00876 [Lentisphaerae bacterium ADurb.BinA184]